MNRKGLSQILYLIIAASVLMMAALSLVFAFQSGVTGSNQDAAVQSCVSTAQTACQTSDLTDSDPRTPSTCTNSDGTVISGAPSAIGEDTVDCDAL